MNKKQILLLFVILSTLGCKTFGMSRIVDSFQSNIATRNFDAAQGNINWLRSHGKGRIATEYKQILNAVLAHEQTRSLAPVAQPDETLARTIQAENEQFVAENQDLREQLRVAQEELNQLRIVRSGADASPQAPTLADESTTRSREETGRLNRRIENLEAERARLAGANTELQRRIMVLTQEATRSAVSSSSSSSSTTRSRMLESAVPLVQSVGQLTHSLNQQSTVNQEPSGQPTETVPTVEQALELLRKHPDVEELEQQRLESGQSDYDVIDVEENDTLIPGSLISKIAARDHLQVLLNVDVAQMISDNHIKAIRDAVCFFINCYSQDCAYNVKLIGISRDAEINLRDIPYLNKCVIAAAIIIAADENLATTINLDENRNPHELAQAFIDSHPNKHIMFS